MHYKGVRKPLPEIAQELQVDGIVEGTVLRSGEQVRISAQLIHGPTDTHLWADSYERDLRNVLALQSEVAQAIAKDPAYAAAYAGLADSLSTFGTWSFVPPNEGCAKAKGFALRALEMDPDLAEAHVSLAWVTAWYDYDFLAAEREFERAIELNPRYATAHYWFGFFLALMGRYEEGYTELKRAIRLDPLSSVIHWGLGFVYWCSRRYDQAIEQAGKSLELDSTFVGGHALFGWAYRGKSLYELAQDLLRRMNFPP